MAIAVCVVVFIVGVALGTKDPEAPDTPSWLFMILVAVTLTVAAIPEGLPLCVTIALSTGCSEMVKENVLMRKIAAVETLGSASIICTDKTGTLTEGKMTLVAMYAGGVDYKVTGKGFDPTVGKITAARGAPTQKTPAVFAPPSAPPRSAPTPPSSSRRTPNRARASGRLAVTPPRRPSSSPDTRLASSSRFSRRRSSAPLRFPSRPPAR